MKNCSLHDFMAELKPWLDRDHIRAAILEPDDRLVLMFQDGMKNVYRLDDCNRGQIEDVLVDLEKKGINVAK